MLNKKLLFTVIAIISVLAYSCKKSDQLPIGFDLPNNPDASQGEPNTQAPTPVSTKDTTKDTVAYHLPLVAICTSTWIDSTNNNSYGIIISQVGIMVGGNFTPHNAIPVDTTKVTILPNGNLIITLPSGIVITAVLGSNGQYGFTIPPQLSQHEYDLVLAIIEAAKKKRQKKLNAQQQQQSHNNPDGTSFG